MRALGDRLVHLLAGDVVRLECEERSVVAEVLANDQDAHAGLQSGAIGRHTIRFMPVGEDATAVQADRFYVHVDAAQPTGWSVGPLVAEVFDEDQLDYVTEPRGELLGLEILDLPE